MLEYGGAEGYSFGTANEAQTEKEVMCMPRNREDSRLKKRRTAKVFETIRQVRVERGRNNELFAQEICERLVRNGKLLRFWAIPQGNALDRQGIDIICETLRGFYFLNVKSSYTGAERFREHGGVLTSRRAKAWNIYPWIAQRMWGQEGAEHGLTRILKNRKPSCIALPSNIQEELDKLPGNTVLNDGKLAQLARKQQIATEEEEAWAELTNTREQQIAAEEKRAWASHARQEEPAKKGKASVPKEKTPTSRAE